MTAMSNDDPEWREFHRRADARRERIEKARGPFERLCLGRMSVSRGGGFSGPARLHVAEELERSLWALREWRRANQQQERIDDEVGLAIRVVAAAMASEINAAATDGQDSATIAWVVAGLRCPSRPFCQGCGSCQTIDSPHRADVRFKGARVVDE